MNRTIPRRDLLIPTALEYAGRGWPVFPVRPNDKRPAFPAHTEDRCTDSRRPNGYRADVWCRKAGRHVTWEERATTDPGRIMRAWQTITPDGPYGIGIACGPARLVVVDLDVPKPGQHGPNAGVIPTPPTEWNRPGIVDGCDVLSALADEAGAPWPFDTYTVCTGSGGTHLYYAAPDPADLPDGINALRNTQGDLGWLIDTRAAGGYVVAPPTIVAGHRYELGADVPVAPLPGWLVARLTPKPIPAGRTTVQLITSAAGGSAGRSSRYLDAALRDQLAILRAAPTGGRNKSLYESALALGQLVAGGELSAEHVTGLLEATARDIGLTEREISRTIPSGLRDGAKRPRILPTPTLQTSQSPGAAA